MRTVVWLGAGILGDDTDGHVDDLARFVSRDTIVTVIEHDRADDNYRPLAENLERLRAMRDQNGNPFRIETLPMPPALYHEGQRLPASYANFYIANGAVLVPDLRLPDRPTSTDNPRPPVPRPQSAGLPLPRSGLGLRHNPLPVPAASGVTGLKSPPRRCAKPRSCRLALDERATLVLKVLGLVNEQRKRL